MCTRGACFVAMMSFTALSDKTAKALPNKDGVISLTNLADELGSMSLEDLVSHGGSYILMREGEAVLIPPGFFFLQCGLGYMNAPKSFYKEQQVEHGVGCNFLVPRPQWSLVDFGGWRLDRIVQCSVKLKVLYSHTVVSFWCFMCECESGVLGVVGE